MPFGEATRDTSIRSPCHRGVPGLSGGSPHELRREQDQPRPTADELIDGYTELSRRLHEAGLTVIAHTIGPYAGTVFEGYDTEEGRAVRRKVNEWIRTTDAFDAVTDVAAAVEDPAGRTGGRARAASGCHAGRCPGAMGEREELVRRFQKGCAVQRRSWP